MVTELRGNVDGPYPIGDVHVFVDEADLDAARERLLADEVEDVIDRRGDRSSTAATHAPRSSGWCWP